MYGMNNYITKISLGDERAGDKNVNQGTVSKND